MKFIKKYDTFNESGPGSGSFRQEDEEESEFRSKPNKDKEETYFGRPISEFEEDDQEEDPRLKSKPTNNKHFSSSKDSEEEDLDNPLEFIRKMRQDLNKKR